MCVSDGVVAVMPVASAHFSIIDSIAPPMCQSGIGDEAVMKHRLSALELGVCKSIDSALEPDVCKSIDSLL